MQIQRHLKRRNYDRCRNGQNALRAITQNTQAKAREAGVAVPRRPKTTGFNEFSQGLVLLGTADALLMWRRSPKLHAS